ncbi:MAG: DUF1929 domain-containing protein [Planctomycetes bacterium]|nr:DUF1929 domain-containing protein [Planctomycetota bacterium]
MASSAPAQITGTWQTGFHHAPPGSPGSTDFRSPFTGTGYVPPPADLTPFGWGYNDPTIWSPVNGNFNAIHMCLIPKGPLQGHILVWNRGPIALKPGLPYDATNYWYFQGFSIIDPTQTTPNPAAPHFRNFLLPLAPYGPTFPAPGTPSNPTVFEDIFCTGHCWNQNGDLVVAGGATFDWSYDPNRTPQVVLAESGAKFLFLFDPSAPSQPFPGQTSPFYQGELGSWVQDPLGLLDDRYYPTVTLSQRLSRLSASNPREVVMVAGGTDQNAPGPIYPEDTYECWQSFASGASSAFVIDPDNQTQSLPGPNTSIPNHEDEWLDQYPRLHLLSDGTIFSSGWAYLSSKVDLNVPIAMRTWDVSVGRTGSGWPHHRHDGSAVFFGRFGPLQDLVVRMCGVDAAGYTDNAEACLATQTAAPWIPLGTVPGTPGARTETNGVILPDGSVVMIGGRQGAATNYKTAVYRNGWTTLPSPAGDSPTPRQYHTTAVLLPDGRVFVGGGEVRLSGTDYDIFVPHYLQGNPPRPTILSIKDSLGIPVPQDPVDETWLLTNDLQGLVIQCGGIEAIDHIERLVLMAPGSMTHHADMTARYVELIGDDGSDLGHDQRVFDIPDNLSLPRGYYMLFALNSALVPSEAAWIKVQ